MESQIYDDITLFEIPIYSMKKSVYLEKWEDKIERSILPQNAETIHKDIYVKLKELYRNQMTWQYNEIIGYITVNVWHDDITFNIYKANQKIRFDRSKKADIQNLLCGGTHFRIGDKDNESLKKEILGWVEYMLESYAKKPRFADTSLFFATIECTDILKLIEFRKNQKLEER